MFWNLVPPLFVIEFLHRIMDVFEDYFGECTETSLKENFVIVYEVKKIFLSKNPSNENGLFIVVIG